MTLYHGSPLDFDRFEPSCPERLTGSENGGLGIWVTTKRSIAEYDGIRRHYVDQGYSQMWVIECDGTAPLRILLEPEKLIILDKKECCPAEETQEMSLA